MNRNDLLKFEGVSRTVLETRIDDLVRAVDALEKRIQGRIAMNSSVLSSDAVARIAAYRSALDDLREHLPTLR